MLLAAAKLLQMLQSVTLFKIMPHFVPLLAAPD
jgi:hypothetical protein